MENYKDKTIFKKDDLGVIYIEKDIETYDKCEHCYPPGTKLTLTAYPSDPEAYAFCKWINCDNHDRNVCYVTIDCEDLDITAVFGEKPILTVIVNDDNYGIVTSDDGIINCTTTCEYNDYIPQDTVVLTAEPMDGTYEFVSWTGCGTPSGNTCTYTFNCEKHNITANFRKKGKLKIKISPEDCGGSVTSDDGIIECYTSCEYSYSTGSTIILTANETGCAKFDYWTVGGSKKTNNPYTISNYSGNDLTVIAYFTGKYKLTVKVLGGFYANCCISNDGKIACYGDCEPRCRDLEQPSLKNLISENYLNNFSNSDYIIIKIKKIDNINDNNILIQLLSPIISDEFKDLENSISNLYINLNNNKIFLYVNKLKLYKLDLDIRITFLNSIFKDIDILEFDIELYPIISELKDVLPDSICEEFYCEGDEIELLWCQLIDYYCCNKWVYSPSTILPTTTNPMQSPLFFYMPNKNVTVTVARWSSKTKTEICEEMWTPPKSLKELSYNGLDKKLDISIYPPGSGMIINYDDLFFYEDNIIYTLNANYTTEIKLITIPTDLYEFSNWEVQEPLKDFEINNNELILKDILESSNVISANYKLSYNPTSLPNWFSINGNTHTQHYKFNDDITKLYIAFITDSDIGNDFYIYDGYGTDRKKLLYSWENVKFFEHADKNGIDCPISKEITVVAYSNEKKLDWYWSIVGLPVSNNLPKNFTPQNYFGCSFKDIDGILLNEYKYALKIDTKGTINFIITFINCVLPITFTVKSETNILINNIRLDKNLKYNPSDKKYYSIVSVQIPDPTEFQFYSLINIIVNKLITPNFPVYIIETFCDYID